MSHEASFINAKFGGKSPQRNKATPHEELYAFPQPEMSQEHHHQNIYIQIIII